MSEKIERVDYLSQFLFIHCDSIAIDHYLNNLAESDMREKEKLAEIDRELIRQDHEAILDTLRSNIRFVNQRAIVSTCQRPNVSSYITGVATIGRCLPW